MAKLEEVGGEYKRPEVNPGTKPRAPHLREPQLAQVQTPSSSSFTTATTSSNNVENANQHLGNDQLQQQQQQWASDMKAPPGFQLAYAYVPEGTSLPRKLDNQTANVLRAFGTGLPTNSAPKKDAGPPPLPPKPKSDASVSQAVALSQMMVSLAKLMASNVLQSEKMLSNCVPAPENGFYNIYSEVGDKFLDLDSSNTKEGTSIIAWPHIFTHNPAQTWKFVRQSKEGYLCTFQNKHSEGHFHVDRAMTREGSPRRIVQTSTPVLWQLLPVGANKFKLSMFSDWVEKLSVLTFVDSQDTYNTIQLLPEDSSNEYQIWTFTTRGLHH